MELENAWLKKMYSDLAPETCRDQESPSAKTLTPSAKREAIAILVAGHGMSIVESWATMKTAEFDL